MLSPEMPCDEVLRQQILDDNELVDTPADAYLDTLVRVVREVFGVKTVLISLIDHDRQWFKSRIGLEITETPRTISFCAHAILGTQPFIVEDTHNDLRFHDNPVVINNPQIRFYAGQPLLSEEGQPLGTLCMIDPEPRQLTAKQLRLFVDMAVLVEGYLKLRHVSAQTAKLREALSRGGNGMHRFAPDIDTCVGEMQQTVTDLLDVSRLSHADTPLKLEAVQLAQLALGPLSSDAHRYRHCLGCRLESPPDRRHH